MEARPKTIQIDIPDGNARSVRIAEGTSRTVQAVPVPRSNLQAVQAAEHRDEARRRWSWDIQAMDGANGWTPMGICSMSGTGSVLLVIFSLPDPR